MVSPQYTTAPRRAAPLATTFGVPHAVAEFLITLADDYPGATALRIARLRDDVALRRCWKLEKQAATPGTATHAEIFPWDGHEYLIAFTYARRAHRRGRAC